MLTQTKSMKSRADNPKHCLESESAYFCLLSSLLAILQFCTVIFNLVRIGVIKLLTEKNRKGARIKIDSVVAQIKSVILAKSVADGFK